MIDTRLKVFRSVATLLSFTKAANELFISQPAISKAISKLEESLGIKLFSRNSRGVQLTREGAILFQHVNTAFDSIGHGERELKRIHDFHIGNLKIGVSNTLCKYVLLPYLKGFIGKYPHVNIAIESQSTYQTLKLLEEDKIDIGLIGRPQKLSGYEFLPLLQIQDTFVATHQYLENQHQLFPSEPLQHTATFMLLDEQNITRQSVNTMLHEHQMQLGHILEVSSMDLLIQFAQVGLGIACVIKEFVQNDLNKEILVEAPLELTFPSREIGFVCKKWSENQKLLTQLAEI